jgi:hypothetical protein
MTNINSKHRLRNNTRHRNQNMKSLYHLITTALGPLISATIVNCPSFAHAETSTAILLGPSRDIRNFVLTKVPAFS